MVRCEVTEKFTLGNDKRFKFEDLQELQRKDINKDDYNTLYVGDTFLCNEEMALYLGGKNPINKVVVKAIEVIPVETEGGGTQIPAFIEVEEEKWGAKEIIEKKSKRKIDEPLDEKGNIIPDEVAKEVPVEEAKEIVKKTRGRKKKEVD